MEKPSNMQYFSTFYELFLRQKPGLLESGLKTLIFSIGFVLKSNFLATNFAFEYPKLKA